LSIVVFLKAAAATITDQESAPVHRSRAICEPMIETRVKYPDLLRDTSTPRERLLSVDALQHLAETGSAQDVVAHPPEWLHRT